MIPAEIKSILLVDDDDLGNFLNKIFIEKLKLDVEVDVALNGAEALDLITDKEIALQSPCLLLLDIDMPVMNGWKFLECYDKLIDDSIKDQIVIVMLTVSVRQSDMIKAKNNPHIKEFVQKPLSEKIFADLIERHFTRKAIS